MNDLISRKAVLKGISQCMIGQSDVIKAEAALVQYVKRMPSAEPERKRGKWRNNTYGAVVCSECGARALYVITGCLANRHLEHFKTKYCPNCGADMRGGEE